MMEPAYTDLVAWAKHLREMDDYNASQALFRLIDEWIAARGRDTVQSVEANVREIVHRLTVIHRLNKPS